MRREIATDQRHLLGTALFLAVFLPFSHLHLMEVTIFNLIGIILSTLLVYSKKEVSKWVKLALLVGIVAIVFKNLGTLKGLDAGVALLSSLAVLKSFEQKTKRDFYIFLLIIQLLLIGQLLSIDGLIVVAYIVIIVPLIFSSIVLVRNQKKARYKKEKFKDLSKLLLASFPIAILLFVFFPRYQLGNIFYSNDMGSATVGLSDRLEPGSIERLIKDETTVFRAKIKSGEVGLTDLYWRASILRETDGFHWVKKIANIKEFTTNKNSKRKIEYEVTFSDKLTPFKRHPMFTLRETTAVYGDSGVKIHQGAAETMIAFPYTNRPLHYIGTTSEVEYMSPSFIDKKNFSQLPPDFMSKRLIELTDRIEDLSANTPDSKALAIMNYFERENFTYTLSPGKYSKQNALEEFLLDRKVGFCEHYASATALLLRKMDILARVVIGFQGGRYNPIGDYYQIRNQDAHAWVEYWNGNRWRTIDPTMYVAPDRLTLGASEYYLTRGVATGIDIQEFLKNSRNSLIGKTLFFIDMLYYDFNTRFLNFDIEAQQNFLRKIGIKKITRITAISVTFGIVIFILTIIFNFLGRSKKRFHPADEIIKTYDKKFNSIGLKRSRAEGLLDFHIRIRAHIQNSSESKQIVDLYLKEKYSKMGSEAGIKSLRALVKNYCPILNEILTHKTK